ncbi:MAG: GGDEF domain-containing protein [Pseudomonadota bacterium]
MVAHLFEGVNMGGAYYIMMVNLAIGVVLLCGFVAFWLYKPSRKAPLFLAIATLFFLGSRGLELLAPFVDAPWHDAFRFFLYGVNLAAGVLLGVGISIHYRLDPHWKKVGFGFLAGLALTWMVLDMERNSVVRLVLNQLPIVIAITVPALRIGLKPDKNTLDKVLVGALSLFSLNLMSRPLILALLGPMGANVSSFHTTDYALIASLSLAIVTMVTACVLMMVLVADLVSDLARKSQTDPLSRLYNRRGFEERAAKLIDQAGRAQVQVSLIVCDIDHFKAINDAYGHAVGDIVIAGMGELLKSSTRKTDLTGRIGGEEFCILLWNTDEQDAQRLANAVCAALPAIDFAELAGTRPVTASFGVAQWHDGLGAGGVGRDALFALADEALYGAKSDGRNRVCVTPLPLPLSMDTPPLAAVA